MKYDPDKHHRHSIRLKGYDYSRPGAYFITICTTHRDDILGEFIDDKLQINRFGGIVLKCWQDLTKHYHTGRFDIRP